MNHQTMGQATQAMDAMRPDGQQMQALVQSAARMQRDAVEFMLRRFDKNAGYARRCVEARSPTELTELNFDWMQDAIKDWTEMTSRMITGMPRMALDAAGQQGDRMMAAAEAARQQQSEPRRQQPA